MEDDARLSWQLDQQVDLLVSDVVMPEASGMELAKPLAARLPGMKVLFMAGYIGDAIVRAGIHTGGKVREVLDGTRVSGGDGRG